MEIFDAAVHCLRYPVALRLVKARAAFTASAPRVRQLGHLCCPVPFFLSRPDGYILVPIPIQRYGYYVSLRIPFPNMRAKMGGIFGGVLSG